MSAAGARIESYLAACIARGDFPGAAWGVLQGGAEQRGAIGRRTLLPAPRPVLPSTLFDLASLTKIATTYAALRLHARGVLDVHAPLGELIPESRRRPLSTARLSDLLAHASGLPAWRPLYVDCRRRGDGRIALEDAVAAILGRRLLAPPRTRVLYSDLGFVLVQAVLERASGLPLDALVRAEVAVPLRADLTFRPPASARSRCAATELGNGHERAMVRALGESTRAAGLRRELMQGEAHDHNAWSLGGIAGHAGLFAAVPAVIALGGVPLGTPSGYLPDRVRRLLLRCHTPGTGGMRSVGLQLAGDPGSSAGAALSRAAVGHTGFTGTSLWADPRRDAVLVLLTNRMHPHRSGADMHSLRRGFHAAALGA